jgi:hypothetical protein
MAVAEFPGFVLDCPDPRQLAAFYGTLLDWRVTGDQEWAEIRPDGGGNCISFQAVSDYRPPQWPGQQVPQQVHLDLMVRDLDVGEQAVLAAGGARAEHQPGQTFRVFLDPAGHPFCLCIE